MFEIEDKYKDLIRKTIRVTGQINNVTWKKETPLGYRAIFKFDCTEINGEVQEEVSKYFSKTKKLIPFVGIAPSLKMNTTYTIVGEPQHDLKYGFQYKILVMSEAADLVDVSDIRKFLEYIVSPDLVNNMMDTLGNPYDVLERGDTEALITVRGIGPATAERILKAYDQNKISSKAFIKLYDYGLTKKAVENLVKSYGSPEALIKRLDDNPYELIYEVWGIGWSRADQIAKRMGIADNDGRRVSAYIHYLLRRDSEQNGNTCMLLDTLVNQLMSEIKDIKVDDVKMYILDLLKKERLYYDPTTRRIALWKNRKNEEGIARELKRIKTARVSQINGIEEVIARCEKKEGFKYSDEQRAAIYNCLTTNVSILTALAGSGKTTSMYPVAQAMKANGKRVALCALSGKASLNLEMVTGVPGSTIHRLLGYDGVDFYCDEKHPLKCDMIILDEASMVDEVVFLGLLKAIPDGCKLVLIGDTGQLEPIGAGCIFHDMINSKCFPHIHLTQIFRQAQKSGIITESRKVYDGIPITTTPKYTTEIRGELQDFKIISLNDSSKILYNVVSEYKRFIEEYKAKPDDIVIVTGKKTAGESSARYLNAAIQKFLNPVFTEDDAISYRYNNGTLSVVRFRVGDRIRVTKNRYETKNTQGEITPVFNGNIGTVTRASNYFMVASFPQGDIILADHDFEFVELGYAITCHSAQGSGYPYVITVCDNGSYVLLSKEWLYTAITRSKKFNTLICQPEAVKRACSIDGIKEKQTWLKDLLLEEFSGSL